MHTGNKMFLFVRKKCVHNCTKTPKMINDNNERCHKTENSEDKYLVCI